MYNCEAVCVFQCALDTYYWTGFSHFFIWGSIIYYFCFILAFYASVFNYSYQGAAFAVFSSGKFWLTLVLTNVILLVPVVAYRFYVTNIQQTLSDRVRMKQRLTKSKARAKDLHVRRTSTFRRSAKSFRSGYAFAHQHGFAELITSGLNMRDRVASSLRVNSPVTLTRVKKNSESEGAKNGVSGERKSQNGSTVLVKPSHPNSVNDNSETTGEKVIYSERL